MNDFVLSLPLAAYGLLMFPADVFFAGKYLLEYDCYRFAFGDGFRFCFDH